MAGIESDDVDDEVPSLVMGASRIMVMMCSLFLVLIRDWLVVRGILNSGWKNEKDRWDFPAASVRVLYVGVTYVRDSLSRWGERLTFTAAKRAAI